MLRNLLLDKTIGTLMQVAHITQLYRFEASFNYTIERNTARATSYPFKNTRKARSNLITIWQIKGSLFEIGAFAWVNVLISEYEAVTVHFCSTVQPIRDICETAPCPCEYFISSRWQKHNNTFPIWRIQSIRRMATRFWTTYSRRHWAALFAWQVASWALSWVTSRKL